MVVMKNESRPVIGGMNPPAGAIASLNGSWPVIGGMNPPAGAIASLNASWPVVGGMNPPAGAIASLNASRPVVGALLVAVALSAQPSFAQSAPRSIPYRGHLDNNGVPQNGIYSMRFELFDAATGGTSLAAITSDIQVTAGEFATTLSPISEAALSVAELYLEISVAPRGQALVRLPVRQRIQAVPFAGRAEPQKDFRVETLAVGPLKVESTGHIRTPRFRQFVMLGDRQGSVDGPVPWSTGDQALCTNRRASCFGFDIPFQTYNGSVTIFIESTAYKAAGQTGPIEIQLGLDPNSQGFSTNIGRLMISYNEVNSHKALPTAVISIPRTDTDCASPPCNHVLRVVPNSRTEVDGNDYLRVTATEFPF